MHQISLGRKISQKYRDYNRKKGHKKYFKFYIFPYPNDKIPLY